ncbi:hypothetical protein PT974_01135 [Cladobotryum mycophilum]|uniref:Uncharacterized protein n=1 Tax=Cladobotryum mycophilum TaxID=491253 RepID=A0ABR0T2T6_9HYPO
MKPRKILYSRLGQDGYLFQLTNLVFSKHYLNQAGRSAYTLPEVYFHPSDSRQDASKMNVWALFATFIKAHLELSFPLNKHSPHYSIDTVQEARFHFRELSPMGEMLPKSELPQRGC